MPRDTADLLPPVNHYSIWLLPSSSDAEIIRSLIQRLAGRFGGPCFEPHMTLLGEIHAPPDVLTGTVRGLARRFLPFELRTGRLTGTSDPYRARYYEIECSPVLSAAAREIRSSFAGAEKRSFLPHLSLAYGFLPAVKDRMDGLEPRLSGRVFIWDHLAVVETRGRPSEWKIVERIGSGVNGVEADASGNRKGNS